MYKDITGIILAGGQSSRMGTNKALLKIGDRTVIEIMARLMESLFESVIISTNTLNEYSFLNCPLVEDKYKNAGPLGGIHASLLQSATERNFVISCDLPLMSKEMIEYFVEYRTEKDILISRAAGYLQPLVGIYERKILTTIEEMLRSSIFANNKNVKHNSLHALFEKVETEIIDPTSLPFYSDRLFFNLNNMNDYEEISRII